MKKTITTSLLAIALLITSFTNAQQTSTALDFDGNDDFLQFNNPVLSGNKTVEVWVKTTSTSQIRLTKELYINRFPASGKAYCFFDGSTGGASPSDQSITSVNDGKWHHIAAVLDGAVNRLYIDGILEASYADSYLYQPIEEIGGISSISFGWFDGEIDELRYWNKALTQEEITSRMNEKLTGTEPNLAVYFDFEEGIPNGDNSATGGDITQVIDQAGSNNGSVNNFTRNGSSSNWVNGKTLSTGNTALDFDGGNDYALASQNSILEPSNQITVETWMYLETPNVGNDAVLTYGVYGPSETYTFEHFPNIGPRLRLRGTFGTNDIFIGTGEDLAPNTWHHVAISWNGTTGSGKVYVNGALAISNTYSTGTLNYSGSRNLFIGSWYGAERYFDGKLDEVRVWNRELTEAEIQSQMHSPLTGTETGLVAYYDFEEGVEFADNTSLTKIFDKAGSNDGTLVGFAKTGTTSNWVSGTNRIGPTNTWLGITSDWASATNWSYEIVPISSNNVLIPDVTIQPIVANSTTATAGNLNLDVNTLLTIDGVLSVNNDIINNGEITFKSDATASGQLDTFTGSISGSGQVTTERYIPAKRAFRLLASPVTTTDFIYENWQESGSTPVTPDGLGTHITGGSASDGFDQSGSNNPSMFTFDNTFVPTGTQTQSDAWTPLSNTNATKLNAGEAYLTMVRGDRTIDLTSNASTPNNTTLSAKGDLFTGTHSPSLSNQLEFYSLVANPYQAVVDYSLVSKTDLTDFIYIWDASIAGDNGRGGYVTVDVSGLTTPSNPFSSDASKFIPPGMSFFVQNISSGTISPSLTFDESNKATGEYQVTIFNTSQEFYINSRLYLSSDLQDGNSERDAIGLRFSESFTTLGSDEDGTKLGNPDENYAVVNNGLRSIDKQALPDLGHEIDLSLTNYTATNYSLTFVMENKPEGLGVFLADNYLNTQTELTESFVYDFSVDQSIPESIAEDRFSLIFDNTTLGLDDTSFGQNFSAYPNPTNGQFSITAPNLSGKVNVGITNLLGQQVLNLHLTVENHQVQVIPKNLSTGVYIVKISQDEQSYSFKLIME